MLVAEDETDVVDVIERQLKGAGHEVVVAPNGQIALEQIEKGLRPEILLTDIVMLGGILCPELAKSASELLPDLKVIFLSGYPDAASLEAFSLPENATLLQKPINAAVLLSEIQKQLETAESKMASGSSF